MLKLNVVDASVVSTGMRLGVFLHNSKGRVVAAGLKFVEMLVKVVAARTLTLCLMASNG